MNFHERLVEILYKIVRKGYKSHTLNIFLTTLGIVFFFSLILFFLSISLWTDEFFKFPKFLPTSINIILSIPILAIGLFLMFWGSIYFKKGGGTPVPLNPPRRLVTNGPYAYIRNPINIGEFIILFGLGILLNSTSLIFIFTPFFIFLSILWLKLIEEPELEKRFGKRYLEYRKKVPMFIPHRR